MKVMGHSATFCWYLLEDNNRIYFHVLCTSSVLRGSVLIALSETELAQFQAKGTSYLDALSSEINASAPQREGSRSPFSVRNVETLLGRVVYDAIMHWRSEAPER
jgi:hypothetical protein